MSDSNPLDSALRREIAAERAWDRAVRRQQEAQAVVDETYAALNTARHERDAMVKHYKERIARAVDGDDEALSTEGLLPRSAA